MLGIGQEKTSDRQSKCRKFSDRESQLIRVGP